MTVRPYCIWFEKTLGKEAPAVFSNTGLEFPEIVRFARKARGEFLEIYPQKRDGSRATFKWIVETYGFPITSKENAAKIRKLRHGNLSDKYRNYLLNGDERGKFGVLAKKWHYLLDTQVDTSEKCCDIMKKNPFAKYSKETGRVPYVGKAVLKNQNTQSIKQNEDKKYFQTAREKS